MIQKISVFKDIDLDKQINEIVRGQFAKIQEVTITFTAASTTAKADVGSYVDRYIVTSKNTNINVWYISSDNRYMYLQSSGAGTVTIKVWKA